MGDFILWDEDSSAKSCGCSRGQAKDKEANEMITQTAISYDIREAREHLARGQPNDAQEHVGQLIERLEFLLDPQGPRRDRSGTSFAVFGIELDRAKVVALLQSCHQAAEAILRHDRDQADSVLHHAQALWEAVAARETKRKQAKRAT